MLSFHYNIIEQADQAGWYGSDMFSCDCLHPVWLYSCPTCTRSVPLHAVQGIIDSGPGQMRENEVFVIVLSSCADSFAFNAGLTDNSKIAFSHQGSIYTAGWFLTGSCFARFFWNNCGNVTSHPFYVSISGQMLPVWTGLLKSLFLSQFLDGKRQFKLSWRDGRRSSEQASGVHETGSWLKVLGGDKRWREKKKRDNTVKSLEASWDWLKRRLTGGEWREDEWRSFEKLTTKLLWSRFELYYIRIVC